LKEIFKRLMKINIYKMKQISNKKFNKLPKIKLIKFQMKKRLTKNKLMTKKFVQLIWSLQLVFTRISCKNMPDTNLK